MRSFQRPESLEPVPGDVVATLRRIDRAAGAEARYADQLPQLLDALRQQARVESVTASSAIEGIVVDDARVPKLVSGALDRFRNRSEAEFAGYTAALDYLNQQDPGELSVGLVLHLHRLLFSFTEGRGGDFKTDDNIVVDRQPDGTRVVRFVPVSARETPFFMDELVTPGPGRHSREVSNTR
jgi:Fic family protein